MVLTLMFTIAACTVIIVAATAIQDNTRTTCQAVRLVEGYILRHTKHPHDPAIAEFKHFAKESC